MITEIKKRNPPSQVKKPEQVMTELAREFWDYDKQHNKLSFVKRKMSKQADGRSI